MATSARPTAQQHVHVHGAEVSTEGESMWDYAEVLALLLAVVALAAAAWATMAPGEGADFEQPAPVTTPRSEYVLQPDGGTAVQPIPGGPQEVAVVVPGGGAGAGTFGDPFGAGSGDPTAAAAGATTTPVATATAVGPVAD